MSNENNTIQNNSQKTNMKTEPSNIKNYGNSFTVLEIFGAFTAGLTFFCVGMTRSWTSPGIFSIENDTNNKIPLTTSHITWIASCVPLGAFFGTILGGPILQFCGRKKTIMILPLASISGWILIGIAGNVSLLLLGRFLTGLAVGLSTASAQLYVSECSRANLRGILGLLPAMLLAVGITAGFSLGTWIEWRASALIIAIFPGLTLLFSFILPESPIWLLMKGREEEARNSLRRLRGTTEQDLIEEELSDIKACLKENDNNDGLFDLLKKRQIWLPFSLVLLLMMFQQFSGISAILYYLKIVLDETKQFSDKSNLVLPFGANVSILIFGLTHVLAFFISIPLIERAGRKVLLIGSACLMCISHIALGIFFLFGSHDHAHLVIGTGQWLPLTALCTFIAAYSIGFASVPYIIMAEVFPSRVRSYLCSITALSEQIFCFAVLHLFPYLTTLIQTYFIFWGFAIFCFISVIFVIFAVPETKGKSLMELERLFLKSQ